MARTGTISNLATDDVTLRADDTCPDLDPATGKKKTKRMSHHYPGDIAV